MAHVDAMLADDAASRSAWLGQGGALPAMPSESIAIECSTLSLEWVSELHAAVTSHGLRMVEAGLKAAGFEPDPTVHEAFTKYRKSHNGAGNFAASFRPYDVTPTSLPV